VARGLRCAVRHADADADRGSITYASALHPALLRHTEPFTFGRTNAAADVAADSDPRADVDGDAGVDLSEPNGRTDPHGTSDVHADTLSRSDASEPRTGRGRVVRVDGDDRISGVVVAPVSDLIR
jgi:hypothetical protein